MSGAEPARRFWERLKAAKARLVKDADSARTFTAAADSAITSTPAADPTSTSTAPVSVSVDITSEDTNHISVEAGTVRLVNNIDSASIAYLWCTYFKGRNKWNYNP